MTRSPSHFRGAVCPHGRFRPLLLAGAVYWSLLAVATAVPDAAVAAPASPSSATSPPDDATASAQGFVSVTLTDRETISGKNLVITAYGVIFGLLFLYVFSILRREKTVAASLQLIENALKKSQQQ